MKRILLLALLMLGITTSHAQITPGSPDNFITFWNTLATTEITIPTTGGGYNYNLYWEEVGNPTNNGNLLAQTGNALITDLTPETDYRVEIAGSFPRFFMNNWTEGLKLSEISQWGTISWTDMSSAFYGCSNMDISASDTPDLSSVTSFFWMFRGCSSLTGDGANWSWNTENITTMGAMFFGATNFNQDIGFWNTANVTSMAGMFFGASTFNQNIGTWNTENVLYMDGMFSSAINFDQNIGNWNTSNVVNMQRMFGFASNFNQDLSAWNTQNVNNMKDLFLNASAFNQNIGNWNISDVLNMDNMLQSSGLDCINYSETLEGWAALANAPSSVPLGAFSLQYGTNAVAARDFLINTKGWTIYGDAASGTDCSSTASIDQINHIPLNIFPNPGSSVITLTVNQPTTAVFMSANGAILANLELNGETSIDVSSYAPGVYFIRTAEGQTVKFIKE